MPRGVVAGVGAIIGFAVGGPWGALQGAAFFSALASLIDPPKAPELESPSYEFAKDRNTVVSGLPVPIIYGKNKVWGNIYRQELKEFVDILNKSPSIAFSVGIGEGPINGLGEIRVNNKLFVGLVDAIDIGAFYVWRSPWDHEIEHPTIMWLCEKLPDRLRKVDLMASCRVTLLFTTGALGQVFSPLGSNYYKNFHDPVIDEDVDFLQVRPGLPQEFWPNYTPITVRIEFFGTRQVAPAGVGSLTAGNFAALHLEAFRSEYVNSTAVEVSSVVTGLLVFLPAGWPIPSDIDRIAYSNNPAWCIYDYLTNTRYSVGMQPETLNLNSFKESADYYDDVLVTGEKRFELNYIIDSKAPAIDHLMIMLASCNSLLIDIDGEFFLKPQRGSDSENIAQVFTRDNYRDLSYYPEGSDRRVNQIKAKFTEEPYVYENQTGRTASGGGEDTIILSSASSSDDYYNGMVIEILSGPGAGEVLDITDYDGATTTATVDSAWKTVPTAASTYEIRRGNFEIISAVVDDEIMQNEDGEIITRELDLLPCNTFSQVARIAQMHLDGVRLGNGLCKFLAGLNSVHCSPGDVVELHSSRYGWGAGCVRQATCGNVLCLGTYIECVETYAATTYYAGVGMLFRIMSIQEKQKSRELEVIAKREHPGIYHDYYSGKQEPVALAFNNIKKGPGPVTDLALWDAGEREPDGKWRKGIGVSFVPPMDSFYKEAIIEISYDTIGAYYEEDSRTKEATAIIYPRKDAAMYHVRVRSVNKFGLECSRYSSPVAGIALTCPPIDVTDTDGNVTMSGGKTFISANMVIDGLDALKSISPPKNFLEYPLPGSVAAFPSIFVDFDVNNLGLYIAHLRPWNNGNIYINDTLIYSTTAGPWIGSGVSMHSTRNGKVYLSMTKTTGGLYVGEVDVTTSPWTVGTPQLIGLGAGTHFSPQIYMIDDTHFWCVVLRDGIDLVLFRADITGAILGSVVTLSSIAYVADIVVDGDDLYIVYLRSSGGVHTCCLQRANSTPALVGSAVELFQIEWGAFFGGNYPHVEKLGDSLYFLFASSSRTGNIYLAKSDLDGNVTVLPHPRYTLLEGYNMEPDSCQGVDLFVGQYGVATSDSIQVAWMQDQYHIGVGNYQHFYRNRLQLINITGQNLQQLHNNLI